MSLKAALDEHPFIVTTEIQDPLGEEDPEKMLRRLEKAVEGPGGKRDLLTAAVGDTLKTCELLAGHGMRTVYQVTVRDKNRCQLQKELYQAHKAGVKDILAFTGDYRISGDTFQESMFFHVDAAKLSSVMEHLEQGRRIGGGRMDGKASFDLGVGVEIPAGRTVPGKGVRQMEEMVRAGARYFLTTPVFELEPLARFMKQAESFQTPVIAEVMILRTAGMGRFLNRHFKSGLVPEWVIRKLLDAPDKTRASLELFSDTVRGLKEICRGAHVIVIGTADCLGRYLNAAKQV